VISDLEAIVGAEHVLTDADVVRGHVVDWTGRFRGNTPAVVRPGSVDEVIAIVEWCRRTRTPVVPQGGNTGLVGGSVPLDGEVVMSLRRLDHIGGRAFRPGLPADRVALVADGRVTLPPGPAGAYQLRVLSDDGVRVWVDGRLVIDNWDVHGTEIDTAPIAGGAHRLKVEYFEASGWAEFRLDFVRNR